MNDEIQVLDDNLDDSKKIAILGAKDIGISRFYDASSSCIFSVELTKNEMSRINIIRCSKESEKMTMREFVASD